MKTKTYKGITYTFKREMNQLAAQARHEREERIKAGIPDGYVKSDGKPSGYLTKSQVKDFNSKPLEERKRILGS